MGSHPGQESAAGRSFVYWRRRHFHHGRHGHRGLVRLPGTVPSRPFHAAIQVHVPIRTGPHLRSVPSRSVPLPTASGWHSEPFPASGHSVLHFLPLLFQPTQSHFAPGLQTHLRSSRVHREVSILLQKRSSLLVRRGSTFGINRGGYEIELFLIFHVKIVITKNKCPKKEPNNYYINPMNHLLNITI